MGQHKSVLALNIVSSCTSFIPISSFACYPVNKQKVLGSQKKKKKVTVSRHSCQKVKTAPQLQFPDNAPHANISVWCVSGKIAPISQFKPLDFLVKQDTECITSWMQVCIQRGGLAARSLPSQGLRSTVVCLAGRERSWGMCTVEAHALPSLLFEGSGFVGFFLAVTCKLARNGELL